LHGAGNAFLEPLACTNDDLIYQDRLGIKIGKVEGKGVFCRDFPSAEEGKLELVLRLNSVWKRPSLRRFRLKNDHFAKTGSEQLDETETLRQKAFSVGCGCTRQIRRGEHQPVRFPRAFV
jgi:hypothetical protein